MLLSLDSYQRNTVASKTVKIEIFCTLNFELNEDGGCYDVKVALSWPPRWLWHIARAEYRVPRFKSLPSLPHEQNSANRRNSFYSFEPFHFIFLKLELESELPRTGDSDNKCFKIVCQKKGLKV